MKLAPKCPRCGHETVRHEPAKDSSWFYCPGGGMVSRYELASKTR